MDVPLTASLAAAALAMTLFFGWRGAQPSEPGRAPRLVPWRWLMLLSFVAMVAMLVHLVALFRGGDPKQLGFNHQRFGTEAASSSGMGGVNGDGSAMLSGTPTLTMVEEE
jgi:hypothetical protein